MFYSISKLAAAMWWNEHPKLELRETQFSKGKKTRGRILQKSKSFYWNRTMLFMLVWASTLYRYCEITADNIEYPEKLVLKLQQQDQILLAVNWSMGLRPRTRTRKEKLKQRIQLPIRRSRDENGSDTDGYHWYRICFYIYVQIQIRIRIV
jgi:hypothetical protein